MSFPVPPPARRFEGVGFSELVVIRDRVMRMLARGKVVYRFEGGEPYADTPDSIKLAMTQALAENKTRYAPASGIPELRQAIVEKVRRQNRIPAEVEHTLVTNGGIQGLYAAFAAAIDPGDDVLLLSPYWTPIVDIIVLFGGRPVPVPTEEARKRGLTEALARAETPKSKLLYWTTPVNPTGVVFSRAEVEEVARFAAERGLLVVSDEAYEELIYEGEHVSIASLPGMFERTLTAFTLSKTYAMTGWRAGYLVAPEQFQLALRTIVLYSTNGVSTPTQWAALEALTGPKEFFANWKRGYLRRRDAMVQGLREAGFVIDPPPATLYCFPRIPEDLGPDSRAVAGRLLEEANIASVPGIAFGPHGEGHLRLSFSVPEEMITKGMEALVQFRHARAGR